MYTYIVTGSGQPGRYSLKRLDFDVEMHHLTRQEVDDLVTEIECQGHTVHWRLGGLHLQEATIELP